MEIQSGFEGHLNSYLQIRTFCLSSSSPRKEEKRKEKGKKRQQRWGKQILHFESQQTKLINSKPQGPVS